MTRRRCPGPWSCGSRGGGDARRRRRLGGGCRRV
jgi:hypothetical protein